MVSARSARQRELGQNFLIDRNKHTLVVLKDDRRHLYQDAAGLFAHVLPQRAERRGRR